MFWTNVSKIQKFQKGKIEITHQFRDEKSPENVEAQVGRNHDSINKWEADGIIGSKQFQSRSVCCHWVIDKRVVVDIRLGSGTDNIEPGFFQYQPRQRFDGGGREHMVNEAEFERQRGVPELVEDKRNNETHE